MLSAALTGALATGAAARLSRASAASSTDASLVGAGTPRGEREGLAVAEPVVVVWARASVPDCAVWPLCRAW